MSSRRTEDERLRLFAERVQRLVERRGLRDATIASRFNMKASLDKTEFTFDIGDEDDLFSVMSAFRQFTADREDTHFPKICNLLEQRLTDAELRDANRANRQAWQQAEQGGVLLQIPGQNLTHRACYDLWLNGEIFHSDADKERVFKGLPEYVQGFIRTAAASFVIDGTRVLHAQRNVVSAHLRSHP